MRSASESRPQSLFEYTEASLSAEIGRTPAAPVKDFPFPRLSEPKNLLCEALDVCPPCDVEPEREGKCPGVDACGESAIGTDAGAFLGRGKTTGLSEGSTELRSGDLDDDADGPAAAGGMVETGRTGTGGTGGSNGVGDVLLIPESNVRYVRLEFMDDERGREG